MEFSDQPFNSNDYERALRVIHEASVCVLREDFMSDLEAVIFYGNVLHRMRFEPVDAAKNGDAPTHEQRLQNFRDDHRKLMPNIDERRALLQFATYFDGHVVRHPDGAPITHGELVQISYDLHRRSDNTNYLE
jgi:hypothetical protein